MTTIKEDVIVCNILFIVLIFIFCRWAGYDVNVHDRVLEEYARVDEVWIHIFFDNFNKLK